MNIVMLNGSPKVEKSNSEYFLSIIKNSIQNNSKLSEIHFKKFNLIRQKETSSILTCMNKCDIILFAFPLYADSIPSHILPFLIEFENKYAKSSHKPMVYVIVNCGFYEGRQNLIAIDIMKNWCLRCGLTWGQGIAIGAGEMMGNLRNTPLNKGPRKEMGTALKKLIESMINQKSNDTISTVPSCFPRFAFLFTGNCNWNKQAKLNGLTKKELYQKL